jgi:hypothetical protein
MRGSVQLVERFVGSLIRKGNTVSRERTFLILTSSNSIYTSMSLIKDSIVHTIAQRLTTGLFWYQAMRVAHTYARTHALAKIMFVSPPREMHNGCNPAAWRDNGTH